MKKKHIFILISLVVITVLISTLLNNRNFREIEDNSVLSFSNLNNSYCNADYNSDNYINESDFDIFRSSYRTGLNDCSMDLVSNDCYLDLKDFVYFARIYNSILNCTNSSNNNSSSGNTVQRNEFREIESVNPWVQSFTPLNELFISSDGLGGEVFDSASGSTYIVSFDDIDYEEGKVQGGSSNQSLYFDGDKDFIDIGSKNVGDWSTGYTVETWIKLNDTSNERVIVSSYGSVSAGGHGMEFKITTTGVLKFNASEVASNGCQDRSISFEGSTIVSDNQWHHVALVVDRSDDTARMYVDGVLDSPNLDISQVESSGCGINPFTRVGVHPYQTSRPFLGYMDELNIFSNAFNTSEIQAAYNGGNGRYLSDSSNLLLGLHFDEGDPGTFDNPYSLNAAINLANPGDLFWLKEGTYSGGYTLTRDGTQNNPIVFRAVPEKKVEVQGEFTVQADYNWIWGISFTDGDNPTEGAGITSSAKGNLLINNYIHDVRSSVGVGFWNQSEKVFYGNIVERIGYDPYCQGGTEPPCEEGVREINPHNVYAQNDYDSNGYMYFARNLFLDSGNIESCNNCFIFHGYSEGGFTSGFYIVDNVFDSGTFLIGGYNVPEEFNYIDNNYFNDSNVRIGYRRPTQTTFIKNILLETSLISQYLWGPIEDTFPKDLRNSYSENTFYNPTSDVLNIRTSAYYDAGSGHGRQDGIAGLDPNDIFDNNKYTSFQADLKAGGNTYNNIDINQWRSLTATEGSAFGTNSTIIPVPTSSTYEIFENEYEDNRLNLVVMNWGGETSINVDISSSFNSDTLVIRNTRDFWGSPISTLFSPNLSNISVPLDSTEVFQTFVLVDY